MATKGQAGSSQNGRPPVAKSGSMNQNSSTAGEEGALAAQLGALAGQVALLQAGLLQAAEEQRAQHAQLRLALEANQAAATQVEYFKTLSEGLESLFTFCFRPA